MQRFPAWETIYREREVERMPWFHEALDPDLAAALDRLGIVRGRALDLGTGPGTQAIALAKRGFDVTGSDVSADAVAYAERRAAAEGVTVRFVRDDILAPSLHETFDVVFDRGCFHVMAPDVRPKVVDHIANLVRPRGHLFLKTFSDRQPGDVGPYRYTEAMVREAFAGHFDVESILDTIYQGQLEPPPFARFAVLVRR